MKLFELFATLGLDSSEFEKGVGNAGEKGRNFLSGFGVGAKKAIGSATKVIGAGLEAAGTAFAALGKIALGATGELEQNLGGSEAVFGKFAKTVQDKGTKAFKSMGLSTSEYLATANKMGALFQGSGFGVEESAEISTKAMQRAADVASIMGIDTATAMESIAGAAKGNFTMMDNLGVAMNDTALNAYALEKGIGKTTEQMSAQEKTALAMEMFLDKTSYAAGNYAKENETLAGSLGTAKAALDNFLSGSGSIDDLVEAFSNAADVVINNLGDILPRLTNGLTEIATKLIPKIPPLMKKLLPALLNSAKALLSGLIMAMPAILQILSEMLPGIVATIAELLPELLTALADSLTMIITSLAEMAPVLIPLLVNAIIDGILSLVQNADQLLAAGVALIAGIGEGISSAIPVLLQKFPQILASIGDVISNAWSSIVWPLIQGLFKAVFGIDLPDWETVKTNIENWWNNTLWPKIQEFMKGTFGIDVPDWENVKASITAWWEGVKEQASGLITAVFSIFAPDEDGLGTAEKIKQWWDKVVAAYMGYVAVLFGVEPGETADETAANIQQAFDDAMTKVGELIVNIFFKPVTQGIEWLIKLLGGNPGVDVKFNKAGYGGSFGEPNNSNKSPSITPKLADGAAETIWDMLDAELTKESAESPATISAPVVSTDDVQKLGDDTVTAVNTIIAEGEPATIATPSAPDSTQTKTVLKSWWEDIKSWAASTFQSTVHIGVKISDAGDGDDSGFATGLDYVPYEADYHLHPGEAVLTELEANNWRAGLASTRGTPATDSGENVKPFQIIIEKFVARDETDIQSLAMELAYAMSRQESGRGIIAKG